VIGPLLNTTVTVYRPAFVADGRGGRTQTFASQGTVRAKVGQPAQVEGIIAGRDGAMLLTPVHVAFAADVRRGDELDAGGTRRLRVVAVVNDSRETYKRADCEVVQGGSA
jgi:head-tail adaptor